MSKYDEALKAVQAYDAFLFSSFGRSFDANKADTLAASAAILCEEAMRDMREPQGIRTHARDLRDQMRAICA